MWLVVGLGNPGPEYQGNRHNVGFMVIDELARRARSSAARSKFGADITEGTLADHKLLFVKPMEFMNVSGEAVGRALQFFKVAPESCVVIHDDLDLAFGRLKLGAGGGHGGHNGLRSIIAHAGPAFRRVRVGISRPPAGRSSADYVLTDFSRAERAELPLLIGEAADAVTALMVEGLAPAMNRFNGQPIAKDKAQEDKAKDKAKKDKAKISPGGA